jgi:hypothetical protein
LVLLLNFGREIGSKLRTRYPVFEDLSKITTLVTLLVALLVVYNAYDLIGFALLGDKNLYDLIFLAVTAIPLFSLLALGYRNMGNITDLVMGKIDTFTASMVCASCGAQAELNNKFCGGCGAKLIPPGQSPAGKPSACSKCGAELPSAGRFCPQCGSSVLPIELR